MSNNYSKILYVALFCFFISSFGHVFGLANTSTEKQKGLDEFTSIVQNALNATRISAPGTLERGMRKLLEAIVTVGQYYLYYKVGEMAVNKIYKHAETKAYRAGESIGNYYGRRLFGGEDTPNPTIQEVQQNIRTVERYERILGPGRFLYTAGFVTPIVGRAVFGNYPSKFVQMALDKLKKLIFSTNIRTIIKKDPKKLLVSEKMMLKFAVGETIQALINSNFIDKNLFFPSIHEPLSIRLQNSLPVTLDALLGTDMIKIRQSIYNILTQATGFTFEPNGNGQWEYTSNEPENCISMYIDFFKNLDAFLTKEIEKASAE